MQAFKCTGSVSNVPLGLRTQAAGLLYSHFRSSALVGWGGPACLLHHVPPDSQRPESGFGEPAGIGGVKGGREAWAAPCAALARALILPILQTHTHLSGVAWSLDPLTEQDAEAPHFPLARKGTTIM